jgi:hypothetical protein
LLKEAKRKAEMAIYRKQFPNEKDTDEELMK